MIKRTFLRSRFVPNFCTNKTAAIDIIRRPIIIPRDPYNGTPGIIPRFLWPNNKVSKDKNTSTNSIGINFSSDNVDKENIENIPVLTEDNIEI